MDRAGFTYPRLTLTEGRPTLVIRPMRLSINDLYTKKSKNSPSIPGLPINILIFIPCCLTRGQRVCSRLPYKEIECWEWLRGMNSQQRLRAALAHPVPSTTVAAQHLTPSLLTDADRLKAPQALHLATRLLLGAQRRVLDAASRPASDPSSH